MKVKAPNTSEQPPEVPSHSPKNSWPWRATSASCGRAEVLSTAKRASGKPNRNAIPTPPPDPEPISLKVVRQDQHPDCFVCAPDHPFGLGIIFTRTSKGRVEGIFPCNAPFQGFPGNLHGGIVSLLLDSAMAHALMAEGIEAVTTDIQVRFLLPVELDNEAQMIGMVRLRKGPFNHLTACLSQGGKVRATARGRYYEIQKS